MRRIERFCKTTRWFHWSFVLPFLGLAGSGAALALREQLGLSDETTRGLVQAHLTVAEFWLIAPPLVLLSAPHSVMRQPAWNGCYVRIRGRAHDGLLAGVEKDEEREVAAAEIGAPVADQRRSESPSGGSTLITSAPASTKSFAQ